MIECPHSAELARLLDGELTENRTRAVRGHVERCVTCRDQQAKWRALVGDVAVPIAPRSDAAARVVARIRSDAPATRRSSERPTRPHPLGRPWLGVIATATVVALVVVYAKRDDGFTARGGAPAHSLARDVDVGVYAGGPALRRLRDGDAIAADTPLAIAYRNLGDTAYAMVFAVDAAGDVHWIAPAYTRANEDPPSVALAYADRDTVLPLATVLDAPAPGVLRVFRLVTTHPLRVSAIEAIAGLQERALRARWPDAEITSLALEVRR